MSRYDDIITKLRAALELIQTANGYRTDAGSYVWINLEYQLEPPAKPCVIIYPGEVRDTLDGDTPPSQGEENHFFPISIEGFIADDAAGSQSQALRQDILQALKADPYFGGLTEGYSGSFTSAAEIRDAGEDGFLGFVQVDATIFYVTAYGAD